MARTAQTSDATIATLGEFGLIDRIAGPKPDSPSVVLGIGDDAAALRPSPGRLILATCDIQVEGRHFKLDRVTPYQLGRRSAAINLSDIAAMGGAPTHALVSLGLPQETEVSWVDALYQGLRDELSRHGAAIVGGNMSSADGVVIDISLLGEVDEGAMLTRAGARPDDVILVTGSLGASVLGRMAMDAGLEASDESVAAAVTAHLMPQARVAEGMAIAATGKATAMIDVSDGLAGDLGHVCKRSGVGARVFAERLPIGAEARAVAPRLGVEAIHAALYGGEDYELIVTCAREDVAALSQVLAGAGTPLTEIGETTEGDDLVLVAADGGESLLVPEAWDHFTQRDRA